MRIELVRPQDPMWLCACNKHDFSTDVGPIGLALTSDNKMFTGAYQNKEARFAIQFPYDYNEFTSFTNDYTTSREQKLCPTCRRYPYRIILNPLLKIPKPNANWNINGPVNLE